ncbi:MAG: hypothetical protein N2Z79_00370 [Candidatus Omnitrophica bacterium]|nr:hypothetical protein [Candidatus Omnitrophota bacterium]
MKKETLIFVVFSLFSFSFVLGCVKMETDVQLTRRIFYSLCSGNSKAEGRIDWERFKAVGIDVGQAYSNIIAEKERRDYRKAFFYNFSHSFRLSGGRLNAFSNWRIKERKDDLTIVATDTASGRVLLFTLTFRGGKRKLTSIDWEQ